MERLFLFFIAFIYSIGIEAQGEPQYVHTLHKYLGIPHRDYSGNIIYSSFSQIEKLLNGDVAGYYDIPGISTDVQKKVFSQSEEYKNVYLPRFNKEKEYLFEDEYEMYFSPDESDIRELKYNLESHQFSFELRNDKILAYKLSNERGYFHVLVGIYGWGYSFCLTYPKSLVSVVNHKYSDGSIGQEQVLYSCVVPETEAARYYPERRNSLLWRFKIEKTKNRQLYGKSTGLRIIEGELNGTDSWGAPRYKYVTSKEQPQTMVVNLNKTFSQTGNTYKKVGTKTNKSSNNQSVKKHVCTTCNGKGWGTGLNDNRRKTCPHCSGKGYLYY
jgi:hypothetical protein